MRDMFPQLFPLATNDYAVDSTLVQRSLEVLEQHGGAGGLTLGPAFFGGHLQGHACSACDRFDTL